MYNLFDPNNHSYRLKLTETYAEKIKHDIQEINYQRIKIFSFVVFLFELLLIGFYDIPRIFENPNQLVYKVYFTLHFSMLLTSIIALFLLHRHEKNPAYKISEYFEAIVVFLFMTSMAVVGFLDLFRSGQIISYISMLTLAGVIVLIKPPRNYIVYSIPHSLFLGLSFYFIEDQRLFSGNLINSTMYFVCILILSRIVYENQFSHMIKNIALIEANEELEHLSNHDFLTNIANRRHFEAKVKEKYSNNPQSKSVLAMIDLDYFKKVNDQYGHGVGDIVLQEVAALMKANIRESDLLARWGGEEFIILFTDSSLHDSKEIVERMRKAIEAENIIVDGNKISITASFGMCKFKSNTETDINNSYRKADDLLYLAKANGRNRIEIG